MFSVKISVPPFIMVLNGSALTSGRLLGTEKSHAQIVPEPSMMVANLSLLRVKGLK